MVADPHRPLRERRYRLARSDALAFEFLPGGMDFRSKFAMTAIIAVAGFSIGLIPEEWNPVLWWGVALAIMAAGGIGALVWMNLNLRRRASRHPIAGGEVILEEWSDHLAERADGRTRNVSVETIAKVIRTPFHVFVCEGSHPLIVPRSAFEDEDEMRVFAETVDEASQRAQP